MNKEYFDAKISMQGEYPSVLIESFKKTAKSYGFTIVSSKEKPNAMLSAIGVIRFEAPTDNPSSELASSVVRDFITSLNLELENIPEETHHPIAWWSDIRSAPVQPPNTLCS